MPFGQIVLAVYTAKKMKNANTLSSQDLYFKTWSKSRRDVKLKTKVYENGGSLAVWNETFEIDCDDVASDIIFVEILAQNLVMDSVIGRMKVFTNEIPPKAELSWYKVYDDEGQVTGEVQLSLMVKQNTLSWNSNQSNQPGFSQPTQAAPAVGFVAQPASTMGQSLPANNFGYAQPTNNFGFAPPGGFVTPTSNQPIIGGFQQPSTIQPVHPIGGFATVQPPASQQSINGFSAVQVNPGLSYGSMGGGMVAPNADIRGPYVPHNRYGEVAANPPAAVIVPTTAAAYTSNQPLGGFQQPSTIQPVHQIGGFATVQQPGSQQSINGFNVLQTNTGMYNGYMGGGMVPTTAVAVPSSAAIPMAAVIGASALPANWEQRQAPDGKIYYVNHLTKTTSWDRPTEVSANTNAPVGVAGGAMPQIQNLSAAETYVRQAALASSTALPPNWEMRQTETGKPYYLNHATKQTSWDPPPMLPPIAAPSAPPQASSSSPSPALPPGWEERLTPEGRTYYLNHQSKTTSWERPV